MPRRLISASVVLVVVAGIAGCHLMSAMPVDLDAGRGTVDRTYLASLGNSTRAVLDALDDFEVKPKHLVVRANNRQSDIGKPGWVGQSNTEYFPDGTTYRNLFENQVLNIKGGEPQPFAPILVSYRGQRPDGREVTIVVRSLPPEARETKIALRVGRDGDEDWSRQLLENVSLRLPGSDKPAEPAKDAKLESAPAATTPPPAELPALPATP